MLTGVDTGFFFALEDGHPLAIKVWEEREVATSVIVLYELQKKLLQGRFNQWPDILKDIETATLVVPLSAPIALKAGRLAHEIKMPGLDTLILTSLLEADCREIYTTDAHFELYAEKGVKIVNLAKNS